MANSPRFVGLVLASLALSACGGGGGGGGGGANRPPTAVITASPACGQASTPISFSATGSSDPEGPIATYSWNFGDNSSATGAQVSHVFASAGTFQVTLTVTDNRGAQATSTIAVTTISGPVPTGVTVSGSISFERVPFSADVGPSGEGRGLDYTKTFASPAREVEVELLRASDQAVLQAGVTNASGQYQFVAPINTDVRVRAKALSRPGAPSPQGATWDIRVRNNTNSSALYVIDGGTFNTCVVNHTRDLKATTGWSGGFSGVYTGTRAAAPFAILDTLYEALQFVIIQGDAGVQLPTLDVYWSEKNVPAVGDFARGEIGTTAYYPVNPDGIAPGLYILGAASNDTDEFDEHVIVHEFQHFLEDAIGRADTVGGAHALDERLDMRVAFSEGYSNAFAAMVLNDPIYRDSFGTAQGTDANFSVESTHTPAPGWYNEASVHRIVWDLFDQADDGADTLSIGYGPMHDVVTSELRTDVPMTSLFPFITALKQRPGVPTAPLEALVAAERIEGTRFGIVAAGMDKFATTEDYDGGSDASLPVYTSIAVGERQTVCGDRALGSYNALGNRRFLRFSLPVRQSVSIRAECVVTATSACTGAPAPDPDFVLRRAASQWVADKRGSVETLGPTELDAGDYVIEVYEYSHVDLRNVTRRDRTCMRITLSSG